MHRVLQRLTGATCLVVAAGALLSGGTPAGATTHSAALPSGVAAVTSSPLPFSFARLGYTPQPVAAGWLPYSVGPDVQLPFPMPGPAPRTDTDPHDSQGVRMYSSHGRLYDHPVAQAQYGLQNLATYQLTKDRSFLDRALAQAQRLVDTHVDSRGAWYFPYPFDFALHGNPDDVMRAPWYSGMAQGQALSLFTRLAQVTGDAQWTSAAASTFASFLNPPAAGAPWVVHRDAQGYLWLEEYPRGDGSTSDFTFNGHMFALFGLYDYARATGDERAVALFDGAATTVRHYGQAGIPNPGWISNYCLQHKVTDPHYHWIVADELLQLHAETGDSLFARLADGFLDSYPVSDLKSTVRLAPGVHSAYRFDSAGHVTASRTLSLRAWSSAPADQRVRVKGRGIYYRITAGALAGYEVPETYGTAYAQGAYAVTVYPRPRQAMFAAGTYSAYRFSSLGTTAGSRTVRLSTSSSAPFDRTAWWGGRRYAHLTAGVFAGYWIPVGAVTLR